MISLHTKTDENQFCPYFNQSTQTRLSRKESVRVKHENVAFIVRQNDPVVCLSVCHDGWMRKGNTDKIYFTSQREAEWNLLLLFLLCNMNDDFLKLGLFSQAVALKLTFLRIWVTAQTTNTCELSSKATTCPFSPPLLYSIHSSILYSHLFFKNRCRYLLIFQRAGCSLMSSAVSVTGPVLLHWILNFFWSSEILVSSVLSRNFCLFNGFYIELTVMFVAYFPVVWKGSSVMETACCLSVTAFQIWSNNQRCGIGGRAIFLLYSFLQPVMAMWRTHQRFGKGMRDEEGEEIKTRKKGIKDEFTKEIIPRAA
jgi:hypothetical protein